jgi:hypothetical protein
MGLSAQHITTTTALLHDVLTEPFKANAVGGAYDCYYGDYY